MANEEQIALLRRGVEEWNAWREANPDVEVDLQHADLQGAYLIRLHLYGVNLQEANLQEAHLSEADLRGAYLSEVDLQGADLRGADLQGADLRGADLQGADLRGADLGAASLSEANLRGAHLQRANLVIADLEGAHLEGADLRGAHFQEANLQRAHLQRARLQGACLKEANLQQANLQQANLCLARLQRAHLQQANLQGADLEEADFSNVDFQGADLHGAKTLSTTFGNVNLREVQGLESVEHHGPSVISIDTLIDSGGQIPEVFLRGCGMPDSWIEYLPALVGSLEPIQYYSCFISYSMHDEAFAQRLHGRLQQEHVRVWYAPHDLKIDKLYPQIDEAIRVYDKLLLILSEESMRSNWVETELRLAIAKERVQGRRVLFPVRLTEYNTLVPWRCFDSDTGRDMAADVRSYYIGDFSTWKDHDAFEESFARLLGDLKATAEL